MTKKVAIIGGGLAGISAAVHLSGTAEIHLFEARKSLGGRVHSFADSQSALTLDNGMHLMIGAYEETKAILKIIGSDSLLERRTLKIPFYFPGQQSSAFTVKSTPFLPGPLHLLPSLLLNGQFSLRELAGLLKIGPDVKRYADMTTLRFLQSIGQSDRIIESFWEPLVLATLNNRPEHSPAVDLIAVLKRGFMNGSQNASLLLPRAPFDDIFAKPAKKWLEKKGVNIHTTTIIKSFAKRDNRYSISTTNAHFENYDLFIFAIPPKQLGEIFPKLNVSFGFSPISSFYFDLINPEYQLIDGPVNALLRSPLHWLFRSQHQNIYSVTSSANSLDFEKKDIETELKKFFPGDWTINHFRRIITRQATPTFTPENYHLREIRSGQKRILFAGDWTDTGLPATIESAVVSGKKAAEQAKNFLG